MCIVPSRVKSRADENVSVHARMHSYPKKSRRFGSADGAMLSNFCLVNRASSEDVCELITSTVPR